MDGAHLADGETAHDKGAGGTGAVVQLGGPGEGFQAGWPHNGAGANHRVQVFSKMA